jgi:hypothetical protein
MQFYNFRTLQFQYSILETRGIRGSDGEVDRASDFHFNVLGSNPGLVIGNFLQDFIISTTLAPSGPLSCEGTFHYLSLK